MGSKVTPNDSIVRTSFPMGTVSHATRTETNIKTAAVSRLCQVKMVALSGMMPPILRMGAGINPFVFIMSAAEDDRPSAQMLPSPR